VSNDDIDWDSLAEDIAVQMVVDNLTPGVDNEIHVYGPITVIKALQELEELIETLMELQDEDDEDGGG